MPSLFTLFKAAGPRGAPLVGAPFKPADISWLGRLTDRLEAGRRVPFVHVDMSKMKGPGTTAMATPLRVGDDGRVLVQFPLLNRAWVPADEIGKLRWDRSGPMPQKPVAGPALPNFEPPVGAPPMPPSPPRVTVRGPGSPTGLPTPRAGLTTTQKLLGTVAVAGGTAAGVGVVRHGINTHAVPQTAAKPPAAATTAAPAAAAADVAKDAPTQAGGWAETAAKYAPHAVLGGMSAYALYKLLSNLTTEPKRESNDFVPKTADAKQFAKEHPFVAGFLAKCANDGCSEAEIGLRIKIAAQVSPQACELFTAAFEKTAAMPNSASAISASNQKLTAPTPAAPKPIPTPQSMMPVQHLPGGNWTDQAGAIHAETPPSPTFTPQPINMQVNHNTGVSGLSGYESRAKAFYSPGSNEWDQLNSPNDTAGKVLRYGGRTVGAIGVGAGVTAAGVAAAPALMAGAGTGLTALGTAARATPAVLRGVAQAAPDKLLGVAKATPRYLMNLEKSTLPFNVANGLSQGSLNPLDYTFTGGTGKRVYDAATMPIARKFTPDDLPEPLRAQLPQIEQQVRDSVAVKFPNATPEQQTEMAQKQLAEITDNLAVQHAVSQKQDPFAAAGQVQDNPATPENERAQQFESAVNDWATQQQIPPEQAKQLVESVRQKAITEGIGKEDVFKAWENLQAQAAKANPQAAQDPNFFKQLWNKFQSLDRGSQMLLALGLGAGALGLVNMLTDPEAGAGSSLMTLLGLGTAGLTMAHNGAFGQGAKDMVSPFTGPAADGLHSALIGGDAPGAKPPTTPGAAAGGVATGNPIVDAMMAPAAKSVEDYITTGTGDPQHIKAMFDMLPANMKEQAKAKIEAAAGAGDPSEIFKHPIDTLNKLRRKNEVIKMLSATQPQASLLDQYQQSRYGGGNPNIPQPA